MPDINTEKVCFLIVKARELESEDEGIASDASNASDDGFTSILTDDAFSTVRQEIEEFVDAMDVDEQCEVVALLWTGRGDFTADEWKSALLQARERHGEGKTSAYLLGIPMLAAFLDSGLAEFGESCEGFAGDRQ